MKELINVAIIGAGAGGSSVLNALLILDNIRIVGIADVNPQAPGLVLAREKGIHVTTDFVSLVEEQDLDVIVEATGRPLVQEKLRRIKGPNTSLMESQSVRLMMSLVRKQEELLGVKELQERLSAILNSAQEGIEVVDSKGKVIYVNKAFVEITQVHPEERIGRSIFEVSPHGALAEVLRTRKAVFGKANFIKGSQIEVVSNASPIIVDGQLRGAVVVFRDVSDYKRIVEKLEESKQVINALQHEINQLAKARYTFEDLLGEAPVFLTAVKMARQAADKISTVLITGESGTGKELFAHAIHNGGPRSGGPFIKVNCAAIPDNLLESELFGYEKGAFTGATKTKMGKFELANGGTIFLDEIGDMSLILQGKLLRVLQEKEIEHLGGKYPLPIDVRVIAATKHDLHQHMEHGSFREDLFYRLNVIHIALPPLRERKEDIVMLAQHFVQKMNKRHYKNTTLSSMACSALKDYHWPGNVRELENLMERIVVLAETPVINEEALVLNYNGRSNKSLADDNPVKLEEIEMQMILRALKKHGDDLAGKRKAAAELGISLATLYNKLKKYEEVSNNKKRKRKAKKEV